MLPDSPDDHGLITDSATVAATDGATVHDGMVTCSGCGHLVQPVFGRRGRRKCPLCGVFAPGRSKPVAAPPALTDSEMEQRAADLAVAFGVAGNAAGLMLIRDLIDIEDDARRKSRNATLTSLERSRYTASKGETVERIGRIAKAIEARTTSGSGATSVVFGGRFQKNGEMAGMSRTELRQRAVELIANLDAVDQETDLTRLSVAELRALDALLAKAEGRDAQAADADVQSLPVVQQFAQSQKVAKYIPPADERIAPPQPAEATSVDNSTTDSTLPAVPASPIGDKRRDAFVPPTDEERQVLRVLQNRAGGPSQEWPW
jgi:hypothetical protein